MKKSAIFIYVSIVLTSTNTMALVLLFCAAKDLKWSVKSSRSLSNLL